jgi:hypothetical protein
MFTLVKPHAVIAASALFAFLAKVDAENVRLAHSDF